MGGGSHSLAYKPVPKSTARGRRDMGLGSLHSNSISLRHKSGLTNQSPVCKCRAVFRLCGTLRNTQATAATGCCKKRLLNKKWRGMLSSDVFKDNLMGIVIDEV